MITILGKNKFKSGQVLHQVKQNETFKDIAKKYNISTEVLKQNPTKELYAGQCILISGLDKKYHVVKPTETIFEIAKKYNTTPEKILEKNHTKNIFIGQLLEI